MFEELERIYERPQPFEYYTASDLWTDEYTSQRMLAYHLDGDIDISSRKTAFIDSSVEWIASRFRVGPQMKIADFGCGPGLYTTRLARTKASITGIDFSRRSIQYAQDLAREEGLKIDYVCRNYLEFDQSNHFDLILMIMCDYCALSPAQRKSMLGKFFSLLSPGSAVLFDVYSLNAFAKRKDEASCETNLLDGFWSPEKYYGFLNTFKYEKEKVVLDKYTIVEAGRIRTIYNWLQYFSLEQLEKELTENGFEVEAAFSDVAGNPFETDGDEFAVVARKHTK